MNCLLLFQLVSKNNFVCKNVKVFTSLFWQLLITFGILLKSK